MISQDHVDFPHGLHNAEGIVRDAGRIALNYFENQCSREIEEKSAGDFVSDADLNTESFIREKLRILSPEITVVGEEFGGAGSGTFWCIDPIDGTSNFLSGLPFWAVSLGYVKDDEALAGAVHMPALGVGAIGSVKTGIRTWGVSQSSKPISPRCVGVGRNVNWDNCSRETIEKIIEGEGFSVVNLGTCASSLMYVACGRLAGYIEKFVSGYWDCAAGIALCRAAKIPVEVCFEELGRVSVRAGAAMLAATDR